MSATARDAGEQGLLDDFLAVLREEQAALIERRTDDLPALAERKLWCAQRLEQQASPALLHMLRDTQQRVRRGQPAAGEAEDGIWRRLREAAELNRSNGVLIDQHLKQVRLSLARIEPLSPTRQLYGRDGQGGSPLRARSFGSA